MRSTPPSDLQPVVFVGPSCPSDLVRHVLPNALVVPPVKRGDLYRFRLLDFSVFIILDGVFSNLLAVSPREVVDVLHDGASVIGASSMGALRAADCGPAGAVGHGRIFRLFRRKVLSSEDEVAVIYLPERPYPALTESLVNIRFAVRRACRAGFLTRTNAEALACSAESLQYHARSWREIAAKGRVQLSPLQIAALTSCDVKYEDALACCKWTAERLRMGRIKAVPRRNRKSPLGSLLKERERTWDPFDGESPDAVFYAFLDWLWLSGQGGAVMDMNRLASALARADVSTLKHEIDLQEPSSELAALLMRFTAFGRARQLVAELQVSAGTGDFTRAEKQITLSHNARDWASLVKRLGPRPELARKLHEYHSDLARVFALGREALFRKPDAGTISLPVWRRIRQQRI